MFLREITTRLTEGLKDEIPDLAGTCRSHPHQAGLRHRDHAAHRPDRPAQPLLLEVGQRPALDRQVLHQRRRQHLVRAHRAHLGRRPRSSSSTAEATGRRSTGHQRQVQLLRGEPAGDYDRGERAGDPRLRLHPHRRHQGSDRRAVRRQHAVRRHHRQPALPAGATAATRGESPCRSTSSSCEQAKTLDPRLLVMVIPVTVVRRREGPRRVPRSRCSADRAHAVARRLPRIAADVFPGVDIKGGVSYFLWDRDILGRHARSPPTSRAASIGPRHGRYLDEYDVFIRFNEGVSILKKVVVDSDNRDLTSRPKSVAITGQRQSSRSGFEPLPRARRRASGMTDPVMLIPERWNVATSSGARSRGTPTGSTSGRSSLAEPCRGGRPATRTRTHYGSLARHSSRPARHAPRHTCVIGPLRLGGGGGRAFAAYLPDGFVALPESLCSKPTQDIYSERLHVRARTCRWTQTWTDADLYAQVRPDRRGDRLHRDASSARWRPTLDE